VKNEWGTTSDDEELVNGLKRKIVEIKV